MITSLLLLLATAAAVLAAGWIIVQVSPGAARVLAEPQGRFQNLDGLRGLLAAGVLIHHAAIARGTYRGQPWEAPQDPLYHFVGSSAVAVFFMITGLLFWDKAIAGRLRFTSLMRSRVRRIVPLQTFCLMLVVTLCLVRGTGPSTDVEGDFRGALRWLGTGLAQSARINGISTLSVDAGVTWSLTIEWLFYLALVPLSAVCVAPRRFLALVIGMGVLVVICRWTEHRKALSILLVLLPFCGGMLAAYLARLDPERLSRSRIDRVPATLAIVGSVCAVAFAYHFGNPQIMNLLLVPAFLAVVLGNDLFTLLRRRALRWLGQISFSLYLLHGVVLLTGLRAIDRVWPISTFDDATYAVVACALGAVAVAVATLTYWWIERPFMAPSTRRHGTEPR